MPCPRNRHPGKVQQAFASPVTIGHANRIQLIARTGPRPRAIGLRVVASRLTGVFREQDVPATDGRWLKVRTMPYPTQENRIDGLVITFSDFSASKLLEAALRATQARLQTLMESAKLLGVGHGLS